MRSLRSRLIACSSVLPAALVAIFVVGAASLAVAAPWSSESSSSSEDASELAAAEAAIEAGEFDRAIALMSAVVAADPDNADAMNYLGFSHRKLGHYQESLAWYLKALAVDPDHRGANEYLGELYLQMGQLDRAELQLSKLDTLCYFGCQEYDDLKEAIADYKAGIKAAGDGRS